MKQKIVSFRCYIYIHFFIVFIDIRQFANLTIKTREFELWARHFDSNAHCAVNSLPLF